MKDKILFGLWAFLVWQLALGVRDFRRYICTLDKRERERAEHLRVHLQESA